MQRVVEPGGWYIALSNLSSKIIPRDEPSPVRPGLTVVWNLHFLRLWGEINFLIAMEFRFQGADYFRASARMGKLVQPHRVGSAAKI